VLAFLDGVDKSAVIVSLVAIIPGALAFFRGKRTDRRVSDLDTLRTIVEALQSENTEISKRLDLCEDDRNEANSQLHDLRFQILQLQSKGTPP